MSRDLTEKQRRFVEAYAGPAMGNGTEAARLAGYAGTDKALSVTAVRLLGNARVQSALEEFTAAVRQAAIMTAEERQGWLTAVARGEVEEIYIVDGIPVTGPPRLKERIAASDQLNRMQASYTEKRQHEHTGIQRVVFKVPDNGRGPD